MATVLVEVLDPLSINTTSIEEPAGKVYAPVIAGSYVQVELPARELDGVFRIPINYLRKDNTVWVADNQKLAIKAVELAFRDNDYAYIKSGVIAGDNIITTDIASVIEGAAVAIKNVPKKSSTEQTSTARDANTATGLVL
jgi:hypothetical protein